MKLIEQSESKLVFRSRPSPLFSWAIMAGAVSCWAILFFTLDSLIVKIICIVGSLLISCRFFEHWRELTFDKLSDNLIYKDATILQKVFQSGSIKVMKLKDIKQLNADTHNEKVLFYCSPSQHLLVNFDQEKNSVESYKALIRTFLNISPPKADHTEECSTPNTIDESKQEDSLGVGGADIDDVNLIIEGAKVEVDTKVDEIGGSGGEEILKEEDNVADDGCYDANIDEAFELLVNDIDLSGGDNNDTNKIESGNNEMIDVAKGVGVELDTEENKAEASTAGITTHDDTNKSIEASSSMNDSPKTVTDETPHVLPVTKNDNLMSIVTDTATTVKSEKPEVGTSSDEVGKLVFIGNDKGGLEKNEVGNDNGNNGEFKVVHVDVKDDTNVSIENVQKLIEKVKGAQVTSVLDMDNKANDGGVDGALKDGAFNDAMEVKETLRNVDESIQNFVAENIKKGVEDIKKDDGSSNIGDVGDQGDETSSAGKEKATKMEINDKTENVKKTDIQDNIADNDDKVIVTPDSEDKKINVASEKDVKEGDKEGNSKEGVTELEEDFELVSKEDLEEVREAGP